MSGSRMRLALFGLLALGVAGATWVAYAGSKPPQAQEASAQAAAQESAQVPAAPGEEEAEDAQEARERSAQREAFAQLALERMREGSRASVTYDSKLFALRLGGEDGGGHIINLHNFYGEYLAAPEQERHRVFERIRLTHELPETPSTYEQARARLLPVVRQRAYFEFLRKVAPDGAPLEPDLLPWRPVGGEMGVSLVYDMPETMQYVSQAHLEQWKVSFDKALEQALENLRRQSREPLEELGPGACASRWGDGHSASRMLLDEVVRRCKVRGQPVVLVPHRDRLLISGTQEPQGLSLVAALAEGLYRLPRPLDGRALVRTERGWEPFLPPRESSAFAPLRRLAVMSLAREHAEQKERLDKLHEEQGVDLFVATLVPYQDEKERVFTQALWVEGVDTLLPRADVVLFMDQERGPSAAPVAVVRWEAVMRDTGKLLEPVKDSYPARYRTKGFPSEQQLARWKKDPSLMDVP